MTKKFVTIEATPPGRSWIIPAVAAVVSAGILFWCANHIYGNCLELSDVFSYCSLTVK